MHTQLEAIAAAVRQLSTAGVNPDELMTVGQVAEIAKLAPRERGRRGKRERSRGKPSARRGLHNHTWPSADSALESLALRAWRTAERQ